MAVGLGRRSLEEAEAISQSGGDVGRIEGLDLGGGEFNGERQPIKVPADLCYGFAVVDISQVGPGEAGAVPEQDDRVGVDVKWRHRPDRLAGHREGLAAGREHVELGCSGQQPGDQVGAGGGDLLAVVENEQGGWPRGEGVADDVNEVALRLDGDAEHVGD